jgi:hypothetical protein
LRSCVDRKHAEQGVRRGAHLVRLVEEDAGELADLRRAERGVERLALHAVRVALRDDHARADELREHAAPDARLAVHVRVLQDVRDRARVRDDESRGLHARCQRMAEHIILREGRTFARAKCVKTWPNCACRRP